MKILIVKIIVFAILLSILLFFNILVFRSEFPYLWFASLTMSILILVFFPYNKFFNNKKSF